MAEPEGGNGPLANTPIIPIAGEPDSSAEAARAGPSRPREAAARLWQRGGGLSSAASAVATKVEAFLAGAGFDRAPWLAVVFVSGILSWFALRNEWQWIGAIALSLFVVLSAVAAWRGRPERDHVRTAVIACGLVFAAGVSVIWLRSEMVGAQPIERPMIERVQGYVLERDDQPSNDRIRLTLAVRDAANGQGRKIRVNVPLDVAARASDGQATGTLSEGAVVRMRVRLMPPASPMLPGAYDFARAAWFKGLSGTGSVLGDIEIVEPAPQTSGIAAMQRALSAHVRDRVDGSAGTIAAAFASGDRGAIAEKDEDAMRDAGLTHLLAISGLHVSAVIAAAYFIALKLLALFPAIALRVRLPVAAAAFGALAGIAYTLLTGAQVPTVRSCAAAMLVLIALALGREALSLRMVAAAAVFVLLLWPESVIGPSFQMSFAAVLAIVALHSSSPVKAFLAPREESWSSRAGRRVLMLFFTGLVIEIALMPIVLFHFHRAGVYGAFANVLAIPLVTFISMPLIAFALAFDLVGLGAPFWWLVERSLNLLLSIAHITASQPGAVKLMPQMSGATIALFVGGGLWLALWSGKARLLGFVPAALATTLLMATPIPDVLIGREGRHVGITIENEDGSRSLLSLRDSRSSYSRDNLLELASVQSEPIPLADWEGARCSTEFCTINLERGDREWSLLLARNRDLIEERALAAACERADIVVADRFLPRSCKPRWLKADRSLLLQSGGLALNLKDQQIVSVAESQGGHGWWRGEGD
ncbi:predicted membrane metal-binding protein [Erythrobacter sp. NAP1]|uniref:ComEC/Rec2 family competence protein n=1 Tax=Erythrobacter sp. NAP1 TaxID=237727 RepID=UPI0000686EA1|nr:ComEC/Rec2 family competence protein [Erythrobacter sp. NAP1]EAQ30264.1 predicted membrane metal-binding protein [Erythrobacter sp. NAP1]